MNGQTAFLLATAGGWLGWILIQNTHLKQHNSSSRKNKKNLTLNSVDRNLHNMRRTHGSFSKPNPDIPHYSRHNYMRRFRH